MKKAIGILIILFSLFGCNQKQKKDNAQVFDDVATLPEYDHDLIDSLARHFLKVAKLPGISIAVAKKGEVIFAKGYGFADVENKIPMSPSTQLRTASVAKVITATALGRLVSQGKLNWDDPIGNYVPYLKAPFASLTTGQLAGHTSGVLHRPPLENMENKQYSNVEETVQLFSRTELVFEPDTDYEYSTNGYNLLSAVIEGASGKQFTSYMEDEIFEPLNMIQTFPEDIAKLSDKDAKLYYFKDGVLTLDTDLSNGSYKLAGAGFRSTATDLAKMMDAYYNDFISPEVVKEMFTSSRLVNGEETQVGIGWRISYDTFGNNLVDHAGNWQGARTVVAYYPTQKLGIALMINAQCQIFIEETAHILAQIFMANKITPAPVKNTDQKVTITNNRSHGTIENYEGHVSLDKNGNGLLAIDTDIEFLKYMPIEYLGFGNNYVAHTSYGMLYMCIDNKPVFSGKLYMYQNRNATDPRNKTETLSFRSKTISKK